MSESSIVFGENLIFVAYRERPSDKPSDTPLDTLDKKGFELTLSWDELFKQFNDEFATKDVVALTQSPKNVGIGHNQVVFFFD